MRAWAKSLPGWGLLSQFSPFRYFPHFPLLSKQALTIEYRVYIWQVSPQLSCGDTCQIWMWFRESNRYFCQIENFAYGEISERSFSNPYPRTAMIYSKSHVFVYPTRYNQLEVFLVLFYVSGIRLFLSPGQERNIYFATIVYTSLRLPSTDDSYIQDPGRSYGIIIRHILESVGIWWRVLRTSNIYNAMPLYHGHFFLKSS